MKQLLTVFLCAAALATVLCGCGTEEPTITGITRGTGEGAATVTTASAATTDTASANTTATAASTTATVSTTTEPTAPSATTTATQPTPRPTVPDDSHGSDIGTAIAQCAVECIGSPYRSGGTGPDAFDNPGFVTYCYKQSGLTVSRTLSAVLSFGVEAPTDALQPGDILLFCEDDTGNPTFAGIYIGNSRFVACKNPDSGTVEQALNNAYWLPRLIAARRAA